MTGRAQYRGASGGIGQAGLRIALSLILVWVVGGLALAHRAAHRHGARLATELEAVKDTLAARRGELNEARLTLLRAGRIAGLSSQHSVPADLAGDIFEIALVEGIDPGLAFALVATESSFARGAISSAGAVGLTQVMPSTAFWLEPGLMYRDLFERRTNLRLGFRYLRQLLEAYDGNLQLALLAYNRGPSRVNSIVDAGGDPSNGYPEAVLSGR